MILGQAYLVRRYVGTWLFPACLFGLFWFGFTFFPLAVLFWVPVHPYAIGFIFICSVAFSAGAIPFSWGAAFRRNSLKRYGSDAGYASVFLKRVFYASTGASVVLLILNLFDLGFSSHDLVYNLISSASAYMGESGNYAVSNFDRFSIILAYFGAMLGGFLFSSANSKFERQAILALSFLSPLLVALTESIKGLLFLCIAFFYAGVLVCRLSLGRLRLFEGRRLISLVPYGAILVMVVTIAFLARGLNTIKDSETLSGALTAHYASYCCGHVYGFSDWFSFAVGGHSQLTYPRESATYGFYTFMALFKLMGSHRIVPEGIFDEYYSYGGLVTGNIFTMFRGLITDFGFIGSVLFMAIVSLILHKSFQSMLFKPRPVLSVVIFVFMVGYFYCSFIVSMLIWNRVCIALVLLWVALQTNKWITARVRQRAFAQGIATDSA